MNSKPPKPLKPLLWNCAHWIVLASIAWATYAQPSYGKQLLDVAAIWIGIINSMLLFFLVFLLFNKEFNRIWKQQQSERKAWQKVHSTMQKVAELMVFAWAGWLWSFGIRLACLFILQMVAIKHDQSQDPTHQARD